MRTGRAPAVMDRIEVFVNAIIIEADDVVKPGGSAGMKGIIKPSDVVVLANDNKIIYELADGTERVNIFFEKNRTMKLGFPIGAITAYFLGETGEK